MLRSLIYYGRLNLAVLLGSAVAATVLCGALLVGDSMRGSLRALALDRPGRIDTAFSCRPGARARSNPARCRRDRVTPRAGATP